MEGLNLSTNRIISMLLQQQILLLYLIERRHQLFKSFLHGDQLLTLRREISLGLLKHQKTIFHKTFLFFFITVLIVRAAAKFYSCSLPSFIIVLEFLVTDEEAAVNFHQADKTVIEKENFLKHRQKILDKFHVVPRGWKPC